MQRMTPTELRDTHKGLLLKDLRIQLRARGLNPAGGREALLDRLVDAMVASQDLCAISQLTWLRIASARLVLPQHTSCARSGCHSLLSPGHLCLHRAAPCCAGGPGACYPELAADWRSKRLGGLLGFCGI